MFPIGMDVHVRNSYLHVLDDAGGLLRHGRCANTLMDLAKFLGPIERDARHRGEPIHAVLESTTNSRAIQRMLTEYGEAAGIDLTPARSGSSPKASASATGWTPRCWANWHART